MAKRTKKSYTVEFKKEAIALATQQGYTVSKAAGSLGITDKLLYNWEAKFEAEQSGIALSADESAELLLCSQNIYPQKLLNNAFEFNHASIENTLKDLLNS